MFQIDDFVRKSEYSDDLELEDFAVAPHDIVLKAEDLTVGQGRAHLSLTDTEAQLNPRRRHKRTPSEGRIDEILRRAMQSPGN